MLTHERTLLEHLPFMVHDLVLLDETETRIGCPLVAKTGSQSHVAGASAYPPTGDIRWPMSAVVLISSALPPTADILDKAGNVSS